MTARKFWEKWGWLVTATCGFAMALTAVPLVIRKVREGRSPSLLKVILQDLQGDCQVEHDTVVAGKACVFAPEGPLIYLGNNKYEKVWDSTLDVKVVGKKVNSLLSSKERKKIWRAARRCVQARVEGDKARADSARRNEAAELVKQLTQSRS